MGEAGNWPAGVKVVAEWFPERERALASGLFNSGSSVGAILAPPLVAWILFSSAGAGRLRSRRGRLALAVLWWPSYRTPAHTVRQRKPLPVRWLFCNRFVLDVYAFESLP